MGATLKSKIERQFENVKTLIAQVESNNKHINEALGLYAAFDLPECKEKTLKQLADFTIPHLVGNQEQFNAAAYDCLFFEYSDQESMPYETLSCAYSFEPGTTRIIDTHWLGGAGFMLYPTAICSPFDIDVIGYEALEAIENTDEKNMDIIRTMAFSMCNLVLNHACSILEEAGELDALNINKGGIFSYDVHDGGSYSWPFYIKA